MSGTAQLLVPALIAMAAQGVVAQSPAARKLTLDDLNQLREVSAPEVSPDGRYLAFLSNRDDHREVQQVWLLDRAGGEAERITDLPGGVSEYAWSPDSRRLALV